MPKLIEIRNATVWRGSTRVFSRLNIEIDSNERVVILGPNGSGKTTLLMLLSRELYPVAADDSSVKILGRERWNVWELRQQLGIVSNDLHRRYQATTTALDVVLSGFFSSIGVHGTLAERISDDHRSTAMRVLADLGIGEHDKTPLGELSTGQQRRCLLARTLVHDPSVLILDEPTTGLDLAASFDYLERVRCLTEKGCNVVMVTHQLNEIPPDINRVILLGNGGIAADGTKSDVLTSQRLSQVYATPIAVAEIDGYFFAYPATQNVT